jgi:hypothetical protein
MRERGKPISCYVTVNVDVNVNVNANAERIPCNSDKAKGNLNLRKKRRLDPSQLLKGDQANFKMCLPSMIPLAAPSFPA